MKFPPEMAENPISFHSDGINFKLENPADVSLWITNSIQEEKFSIGELSFIFTTDENLIEINQQYLDHDTFTDVITFDYCEGDIISGEIYISIERIRENAVQFSQGEFEELHRVMIHGVLHLCRYGDKGADQKSQMTRKEDYYLSLRTF